MSRRYYTIRFDDHHGMLRVIGMSAQSEAEAIRIFDTTKHCGEILGGRRFALRDARQQHVKGWKGQSVRREPLQTTLPSE